MRDVLTVVFSHQGDQVVCFADGAAVLENDGFLAQPLVPSVRRAECHLRLRVHHRGAEQEISLSHVHDRWPPRDDFECNRASRPIHSD